MQDDTFQQSGTLPVNNKPSSKGLVIVLAILGVIVLIGIVGVGIYILGKNKEDSRTKSSNNSVKMSIDFDKEELGGCSNFFIYQGNNEQTEYITVDMNKEKLGITSGKYTFKIENYLNSYISVKYETYNPGIKELTKVNFPYCNDVAPFAEPTSYGAISGEVEIVVSENTQNEGYFVDVILRNVVFKIASKEVILEELEITKVNVGWLPG